MASTYGYITVTELEAYHILDYANTDARYTDAVVEAKISHAERTIRSLTRTTSSTDGIKSLVLEFSKYLMDLQIYEDHPEFNTPPPDPDIFNRLMALLNSAEAYSPAGTVPMNRPDR